jgi:UDP-N-acetylglucosamine--N-acetylmuramyl-(pentapeptide) pyrophosphoryl-undecaprenol N-acetylglucosamine transferase
MSTTPIARTILIMAGGTGGHVFPGLAVAETMRARAWNVVWLGNPTGMEATLVPRHGIPMQWVRIGGLRGKGLMTKLMLPVNLLRAFWQSLSALRAVRPSVVHGMGGYVAFPGGMMAALTRIPLVVHEQNSVAGLTNRSLARVADRVLVAFPDAIAGAQWCGNPVRDETAREAIALDQRLRDLWSQHPHFVLVPHNPSFFKKISAGLAALESLVSHLEES